MSLAGEADFHALEARHGVVYGLNSLTGDFMVSQDQQTWEARSQIPMADFAVSPQDPDVLIATTQQGPVISADGGRAFEVLRGAPLVQLVSWSEDGTVFGVEPDGTVHASTDDGRTWSQRGSLDAGPHAFTAGSAGPTAWHRAATHRRRDRSWPALTRLTSSEDHLLGVLTFSGRTRPVLAGSLG